MSDASRSPASTPPSPAGRTDVALLHGDKAPTAAAVAAAIAASAGAARRFDYARHRGFVIAGQRVGWIREDDVALLSRWPAYFSVGDGAASQAQVAWDASDASGTPESTVGTVRLADTLDTVEKRTAALGEVIRALADAGRITGWRNETFAIRNAFDDPPLAFIERAASRFFGTMTYAVHVNGLVDAVTVRAGSDAKPDTQPDVGQAIWIARRSRTKAVDPDMLDTLVGGGIPWGCSIPEALVKECWEESGIAADLASQARPGRTLHVLTEIEQGTQAEQLFVFDLLLPDTFVPTPEDGEVGEHLRVSRAGALHAVISGEMTMDACIATLDCALRDGWAGVDDPGAFATLLQATR